LDELRAKIDALDSKILKLLNERVQHAIEIGKIKHSTDAACYVPEREKLVYNKLKNENGGPLPEAAVRAIYREVISATRALERPVSVAFLGPRDTFSHKAAMRVFGSHTEYHPVPMVEDIFTEVERKRVDYGVVPVETSLGGGVSDAFGNTLDLFIKSELKVVNEVMLRVHQCLLSNSPLEEIERVYSKSQPFVQCRSWLKANLPDAKLIEMPSTAEAARIASGEAGSAAIASDQAAETYRIDILVPGIEDSPNNFTRFLVVGPHLAKRTGHDKTSLLCAVTDRPGALSLLLKPFADRGVSLTRIESRPSQKKAWEYVFFIDMLGHTEDAPIAEAMEEALEQCKELKVLGSFPHGELEE
jgi:chorismate mutase/prephenate dehydratase